jgi:phosphoenolpyruvate carboxylase
MGTVSMGVDNTALLMPTSAKQLLRDDDSLLRQMFFNVLRHHHPNTANKVDVIYALSQAWCTSKDDSDFELLEKYLDALKPDECILVSVDTTPLPHTQGSWRVIGNVRQGRRPGGGGGEAPPRSQAR